MIKKEKKLKVTERWAHFDTEVDEEQTEERTPVVESTVIAWKGTFHTICLVLCGFAVQFSNQ